MLDEGEEEKFGRRKYFDGSKVARRPSWRQELHSLDEVTITLHYHRQGTEELGRLSARIRSEEVGTSTNVSAGCTKYL